jgi:hypothetical protein
MSVKIIGPRLLTTAATSLLSGAAQASLSLRFRVESESVPIPSGANLFGRTDNTGFTVAGALYANQPAVGAVVTGQNRLTFYPRMYYTPGRAYHMVVTWDATTARQVCYIDGLVLATTGTGTNATTLLSLVGRDPDPGGRVGAPRRHG